MLTYFFCFFPQFLLFPILLVIRVLVLPRKCNTIITAQLESPAAGLTYPSPYRCRWKSKLGLNFTFTKKICNTHLSFFFLFFFFFFFSSLQFCLRGIPSVYSAVAQKLKTNLVCVRENNNNREREKRRNISIILPKKTPVGMTRLQHCNTNLKPK